ncbi:MGH1-like glycoside hydrolase domain-containing protein [Paenibacillus sp. strain BS8-2]
MNEQLLEKLRNRTTVQTLAIAAGTSSEHQAIAAEWDRGGVAFAASSGMLEDTHSNAMQALLSCIVPTGANRTPILHEGGVYRGCWLESTGTINAELLSRFVPSVAESTFAAFAEHQREDGLIPYKVTENGPVFRQIQLVTPLARSVWNHYRMNPNPGSETFLSRMYSAMERYDDWLMQYRNTRGTGCIEAFSTFDTGHDLSPRFWHVPDTPHGGDPASVDPHSPLLPFLAPDLTANVYCQRLYLAKIADTLGLPAAGWSAKAEQTLESLFAHCFDERDTFFYDRDRHNRFVRLQSDVLLRVMACEVGDRAFFDEMLQRYLLNTRKFFAKYPFTSIAMDDPRFDPSSAYNTWGGTSNFLSIIRAPHAFEKHGRHVELTWVLQPIVSAAARMKRFAQTISPWTGEEGFTEVYSPSILCVLDFVERLCGIRPTPEGELWFTALRPYPMDHGEEIAEETAYSRWIDGIRYELLNGKVSSTLYREGRVWMTFPGGIRVRTNRQGELLGVTGMTVQTVSGELQFDGAAIPFEVKGNEVLAYRDGAFVSVQEIGIVYPTYE